MTWVIRYIVRGNLGWCNCLTRINLDFFKGENTFDRTTILRDFILLGADDVDSGDDINTTGTTRVDHQLSLKKSKTRKQKRDKK